MDRISGLPDHVIDHILEKLPVIDRVKTGTLSRSWRLKWTLLPSLSVDMKFLFSLPGYTRDVMIDPPLGHADIVNSLVLQHSGSLKKFSLRIFHDDETSYSLYTPSIDHVMNSSHCLQRLSLLVFNAQGICPLPPSIFSSERLRYLQICGFQFQPPSWFAGFPNLAYFSLDNCTSDSITDFVSRCPRLESITLHSYAYHDDHTVHLEAPKLTRLTVSKSFIHIRISNAQNLESVVMWLPSLTRVDLTKSADMFKLFSNLTKLQMATLGWCFCEFLGSCNVIHKLPKYDRMKVLHFIGVALHDVKALQCLLCFCVSSPNVEKLKIWPEAVPHEPNSEEVDADLLVSLAEKYINGNINHLMTVDLFQVHCTKVEMKIIELLLRFSPVLEGIHITFSSSVAENVKLQCLQTMMNFYQASTKVKFDFPEKHPLVELMRIR